MSLKKIIGWCIVLLVGMGVAIPTSLTYAVTPGGGAPISDLDVNQEVRQGYTDQTVVNRFADSFTHDVFFTTNTGGTEGIIGIFVQIAFQVKNFFIVIAVIFLIIGVLKLLFADGSDDSVQKWKQNIIWTSAGIFFMQIAFSIWNTLLITDNTTTLGAVLSWQFWNAVLAPVVSLMQFMAAFLFLGMMIYAFYMIVTGGGDDEKVKKGKRLVIYALAGFLLVRLPYTIVSLIYGGLPECNMAQSNLWSIAADPCSSSGSVDLSGMVGLVATIIKWLNGFLTILCIILVIYAGWLVLIS